jgi:hypothetical protein
MGSAHCKTAGTTQSCSFHMECDIWVFDALFILFSIGLEVGPEMTKPKSLLSRDGHTNQALVFVDCLWKFLSI